MAPRGNPDIYKYAKPFTSENQPAPNRKASIRAALQKLVGMEMPAKITETSLRDALKKAQKRELTGAEHIAIKRFMGAMAGVCAHADRIEDAIDGKLAQTNLNQNENTGTMYVRTGITRCPDDPLPDGT